ncbi:type II secretion system F family protein [Candidatus Woesearchaeota archaeon]|nr:type II secretion system F family protein [Candidatus Woesearchaeota archaeon]
MFSIKNIFKKKTETAQPESRIEFFKKKFKKSQEKKIIKQERRQRIREYLERANIDINPKKLSKTFFNTAVLINLAISGYLVYYFSVTYGITWGTVIASMIVLWIFIFVILIFALWIMFYLAVDLKIFRRKVDIEEVLPDFLQLTASNINAGMTIDRALWYAIRPRFGVLAKEIEMVAKESISGTDLKTALERFAARYDSAILKRSISMLNEGVEAGGRIGDLLNKIATNIQEQKSMLKEMSANVTTYVIFIIFSTVIAAPFLFAMSGVLIEVVHNLGSALGGASSAAAGAGLPLTFSGTGVSQSDFRFFAIASLMITSLFSAMMVSVIKKGNVKSGIKYIPIFMLVSLTLYILVQGLAGKMLGLFFSV